MATTKKSIGIQITPTKDKRVQTQTEKDNEEIVPETPPLRNPQTPERMYPALDQMRKNLTFVEATVKSSTPAASAATPLVQPIIANVQVRTEEAVPLAKATPTAPVLAASTRPSINLAEPQKQNNEPPRVLTPKEINEISVGNIFDNTTLFPKPASSRLSEKQTEIDDDSVFAKPKFPGLQRPVRAVRSARVIVTDCMSNKKSMPPPPRPQPRKSNVPSSNGTIKILPRTSLKKPIRVSNALNYMAVTVSDLIIFNLQSPVEIPEKDRSSFVPMDTHGKRKLHSICRELTPLKSPFARSSTDCVENDTVQDGEQHRKNLEEGAQQPDGDIEEEVDQAPVIAPSTATNLSKRRAKKKTNKSQTSSVESESDQKTNTNEKTVALEGGTDNERRRRGGPPGRRKDTASSDPDSNSKSVNGTTRKSNKSAAKASSHKPQPVDEVIFKMPAVPKKKARVTNDSRTTSMDSTESVRRSSRAPQLRSMLVLPFSMSLQNNYKPDLSELTQNFTYFPKLDPPPPKRKMSTKPKKASSTKASDISATKEHTDDSRPPKRNGNPPNKVLKESQNLQRMTDPDKERDESILIKQNNRSEKPQKKTQDKYTDESRSEKNNRNTGKTKAKPSSTDTLQENEKAKRVQDLFRAIEEGKEATTILQNTPLSSRTRGSNRNMTTRTMMDTISKATEGEFSGTQRLSKFTNSLVSRTLNADSDKNSFDVLFSAHERELRYESFDFGWMMTHKDYSEGVIAVRSQKPSARVKTKPLVSHDAMNIIYCDTFT